MDRCNGQIIVLVLMLAFGMMLTASRIKYEVQKRRKTYPLFLGIQLSLIFSSFVGFPIYLALSEQLSLAVIILTAALISFLITTFALICKQIEHHYYRWIGKEHRKEKKF